MFTGIIAAVGRLAGLERQGQDARLTIDAGELDLGDVILGDSIAVSGACLTVVKLAPPRFSVDVSRETLVRTTLGSLAVGDGLNLEKALRLGDRLGGHLVSGHVDGVGVLRARVASGRSERFTVEAPAALARYIAEKGSVCIDGVSLTVNGVRGTSFDLQIIPHTLAETTLRDFAPGQRLNIEVDLIARYLERMLSADAETGNVSLELLARAGFTRSPG